jgi:hypothetical protein
MKFTLKEIVDEILSAMESDAVNSINDTQESQQVAMLVQRTFYDIATELDLNEQDSVFELVASGDNNKPTLMTLPTNCVRLDAIRYDNKLSTEQRSNYQNVHFVSTHEFIDRMNGFHDDASANVGTFVLLNGSDTFNMHYLNDRMPSYYTVFGDNQLVFDAYDSDEDTTLEADKTMAFGRTYPSFTLGDDFVPPLSPTQFAYFRNKCKARAFVEMKQIQNTEAQNEARIQKIAAKRRGRRTPDLTNQMKTHNRFGRK